MNKNVCTDVIAYVDALKEMDYDHNDVYELYNASLGESGNVFKASPANNSEENIYIESSVFGDLIVTPSSGELLRKYLEETLCQGMDVETYWDLNRQREKED